MQVNRFPSCSFYTLLGGFVGIQAQQCPEGHRIARSMRAHAVSLRQKQAVQPVFPLCMYGLLLRLAA